MDNQFLNVVKRPSGESGSAGRGEYELSGSNNGHQASELIEKSISVELFGKRFPTQVRLQNQGGKLRFRLQNPNDRSKRHLAPTVAALLLMPEPCRSEEKASQSYPVLQDSAYVLDLACELVDVGVEDAVLAPHSLKARSGGLLDNSHRVDIVVADRVSDIREMFKAITADYAPSRLRELLKKYESVVNDPSIESYGDARNLVREIMSCLDMVDENYLPDGDPLPFLLNRMHYRTLTESDVPNPEEMPKPNTNRAIRARERSERWYKRKEGRGAAARQFADDVIAAYKGKCVICGAELPSVSNCGSGIEAAHILPWSSFDLDDVRNGLALCRNHHWAFDSRVLRVDCEDELRGRYLLDKGPNYEDYRSNLTTEPGVFYADLDDGKARYLDRSLLPENQELWPCAEYLSRYNNLYSN